MKTTIADVARAVGVSQTTVSRALNGHGRISEQTRRAVVRAAVELDYGYVQSMDRKANLPPQTIAVILPDMHNAYLPEILKGVTQAADSGGHLVIVSDSGHDSRRGWASLAGLRRKGVSGMIIVESVVALDRLQAATAGIPVVVFDRTYSLEKASTVQADQAGGARAATEHLISLGHEHIVHFAGPADQPVAQHRIRGYEEAMTLAGLTPRVIASDWSEQAGYESATRLMDDDRGATAVFAASDPNAIGVLAALDELGVTVPSRMSVVGFDDLPIASYTHPRLTTVRQDGVRLGAAAAMMIIRQIEEGRLAVPAHETIPVELILRGSTARPPVAGAPGSEGDRASSTDR